MKDKLPFWPFYIGNPIAALPCPIFALLLSLVDSNGKNVAAGQLSIPSIEQGIVGLLTV